MEPDFTVDGLDFYEDHGLMGYMARPIDDADHWFVVGVDYRARHGRWFFYFYEDGENVTLRNQRSRAIYKTAENAMRAAAAAYWTLRSTRYMWLCVALPCAVRRAVG